jgi:ribonucleoside-diphosphate reductase alpha chain
MQAAFQKHCDASISKTINFPADATPEDVDTIYKLCHELKCKGVTVYRDACRSGQPMALESSPHEPATAETAQAIEPTPAACEPKDLPEVITSLRLRQMTPFGNMHVHITIDPRTERELEVFAQLGKGGDLAYSDLEAICRMVSLWLRAGGQLHDVIQQLQGIGSSLQVSTKEGRIMSLPDGLAHALIKYSHAKNRLGLRNLLLGEYSLDDLGSALRGEAPLPTHGPNGNGKKNGNGNGNGNGKRNGNGHESASGLPAGTAPAPGPAAARTATVQASQEELFKTVCPVCGIPLRHAEGCRRCEACGWAQC